MVKCNRYKFNYNQNKTKRKNVNKTLKTELNRTRQNQNKLNKLPYIHKSAKLNYFICIQSYIQSCRQSLIQSHSQSFIILFISLYILYMYVCTHLLPYCNSSICDRSGMNCICLYILLSLLLFL